MNVVKVLAWAVAIAAAPAFAVTIDYATVGNPGNPANPVTGWGAVTSSFRIASIETTNRQYVEFLNAVDRAGTNPNGVYSSQMGADANGGITFNAAAGAGGKYAVKGGVNPNGFGYATTPVLFTTWFSAARFANWLGNGQQADAASMEDGTYTLANQTSGGIRPRNPGTGLQVALPSRDEWYKAAYYDGGGYVILRGTNTINNLTALFAANYGGDDTPTFGPIAAGAYVNSTTPYGLYDMLGSVTEYTDTAGTIDFDAGRPQVFSGSWASPLADMGRWNVSSPAIFRSATTATGQVGFRVAVVEAVPEPATSGLLIAAAACAAYRRLCSQARRSRSSRRLSLPARSAGIALGPLARSSIESVGIVRSFPSASRSVIAASSSAITIPDRVSPSSVTITVVA